MAAVAWEPTAQRCTFLPSALGMLDVYKRQYADRPVLGISLQYIRSLGSIWLICALLQRRRAAAAAGFPD